MFNSSLELFSAAEVLLFLDLLHIQLRINTIHIYSDICNVFVEAIVGLRDIWISNNTKSLYFRKFWRWLLFQSSFKVHLLDIQRILRLIFTLSYQTILSQNLISPCLHIFIDFLLKNFIGIIVTSGIIAKWKSLFLRTIYRLIY